MLQARHSSRAKVLKNASISLSSLRCRFRETICGKPHRPHDLPHVCDDDHFLQVSLTILKFVAVM